MRVGPNCAELSTLLNEIDVPHYEAAVITDLSTESGTTLLNGLPRDAPLAFSAYLPERTVTLILSRQGRDSVPSVFDPRTTAGWLLLSKLRLLYTIHTRMYIITTCSSRTRGADGCHSGTARHGHLAPAP